MIKFYSQEEVGPYTQVTPETRKIAQTLIDNTGKYDQLGTDIVDPQTYNHTVAIDFDGVIHQYTGWKGGNLEDLESPVPGVENFLKQLKEKGKMIIIYTARPPDPLPEYLEQNNLYQYIDGITNLKVPASVYIDDQTVTFDGDHSTLLNRVLNHKPWWKE